MLSIKINDSGNEAFADDARAEVVRILREVARKIELGRDEGACMDANGNRVGRWDLSLPDQVCPQCDGEDIDCTYCEGTGTVTPASNAEWKRQNN